MDVGAPRESSTHRSVIPLRPVHGAPGTTRERRVGATIDTIVDSGDRGRPIGGCTEREKFQKTMSGMASEKLLTLYSGQMDLDAYQVLSLGRQFNEICCTPTPH
ncbi:hypothetical protein [Paraburkholderia terrae]|uniref:hypothetical protein n=1 Tax=Paraburkholderia terrae TaxID=311230 RepID=UPI001E56E34C|nr:hypothetical protein [Paraburkholderia terrae]